jgi:hypothetical protein
MGERAVLVLFHIHIHIYTCEQLEDVTGDGNCLFRSISLQLMKTQGQHIEIRERLVQWIVDNEEW